MPCLGRRFPARYPGVRSSSFPQAAAWPERFTRPRSKTSSATAMSSRPSHTPTTASLPCFPDGHVVTHDGTRWPEIPSVAGEINLNQLEWHARDITFVVDELSRANQVTSSALPFARHLQLSRIGAFGHSLGGMAAAHACQIDRRIKACLNQDGAAAMKPFYLDARGWGLDQPFMLIERAPPTTPPRDQELAEMKLTRPQADQLIARLRHDRNATLRSTAQGSYRVVLESALTTHEDFTDLPYLGASTALEADARARILAVVRTWTRAFFDETLRGQKQPMLATQAPHELVQTVQRFPPAKRAW